MNKHPCDQALLLEAAGSDRLDTWLGVSSLAYWNMVATSVPPLFASHPKP